MAEFVVGLAIDQLAMLLVREANLLMPVHKEVANIRSELESIQSFLRDADRRAETEDVESGVKTWVKQVREVAYRIEDIMDKYVLHLAKRGQGHGLRNFFGKLVFIVAKLKARHDIASDIQDINKDVSRIKERAERYRFSSLEQISSSGIKNEMWHDPRKASLFIEEDELVGIDSPKRDLINRLLTCESKRLTISIVGMGGLGKTTLAKKVYDNQQITGHFECQAWISVSQSYKPSELLKTMIKEFYQSRKELVPEGVTTMEETSLIIKLREYLDNKRYVVVFDDVWRMDFWRFIKPALPNNGNGSRVIFTTRDEAVVAVCKESSLDHVHKLQPLPQEKAWELFCRKVFGCETKGDCPQELEELSLEIVRKCEGLPLAIVAISGLLATKDKVVSEWIKLCQSLGLELERNPHLTSIGKIVFLGYHDLPYYLKSCFLYLGMLPEDHSIRRGRLIRLWIAEGFIKNERGKTLEEVAEEYLIELMHRSLVQVSMVNDLGKAVRFRLHDLVREMILLKSKELSFCEVLQEMDSNSIAQARRLSIHDKVDDVVGRTSNSRIRSLFLYTVDEQLPKSWLDRLFEKFKLLKVLDLEDAPVDYLPKEVGNLFHLAYLSLSNTRVKRIPKSIGKLHNLLTLDLNQSLVDELPVEINELRKLRHLLARNYKGSSDVHLESVKGVKIQEGIGRLEDLQKLYHLEANHEGAAGLILELKNLRQLRTLGIRKLTREKGYDLCSSIEMMKKLKSLFIVAASEDEIMELHYISSPPQYLQKLAIWGRLENLPNWVPKLQNLVILRLGFSKLTNDPLKALQVLPNLSALRLFETYDGEQLHFEAGGFPKLKRLDLFLLNRLKEVMIDARALPLLAGLRIGKCSQLKEVPSGIQHLKTLRNFEFGEMPNEFTDRLKPSGGQDYWIVEHIPNVGMWLSHGENDFDKFEYVRFE